MPTVPRVSGPEVAQQGLPGVQVEGRVTPEDFGAGRLDAVAQNLARAAGEQQQIAQREKEKTDMAQVTSARNELSSWENNWFDPNNQQGVRAYQGAAALGLNSVMQQDYKRQTATIARGLANEDQRQAFGNLSAQYGEQVRGRINAYAYGENQKFQADAFKSSLATSANTAATAARDGDMDRARREMAYADTLIDQNARLTGEPPELVAERKRTLLSQTNLAGVAGMVSAGRVKDAEEFWSANREHMSEADSVSGAKAVVLGRIQENPQAMAYALSASVPRQEGASLAGLPATPIAQIRTDAAAAGVPPQTALAIAHLESGLNPGARNDKSTAAGLFQLLDSSRQQYAGSPEVGDTAAQSKAGIAYIADSYKALRGALGREPAPHEVYMAHLFGQAGAQAVLKAPDGERVIDVVRRYDPRNAVDIVANNGMSGLTVGQVKDKWQAKVGEAMTTVARIPEEAPPVEQDARRGELGTLSNPDGSISTEISITVTDPELNGGRATNIPLLVKGQTGVERLQAGDGPTPEQERIAIQRAAARVKDGAALPSFDSIQEAEAAAAARSEAKGAARDKDELISALPIENRIQLQSAAESQARQVQSQSRADLQVQVQDAVAALSRGENPRSPLSYDDFAAAYPPPQAAREFADYRGWQQFGSDVGQLKTMPSGDMGRYLEQRKPAPGSPGYADAARRYDGLVQAATHVQQARLADPIQAALTAGGMAVAPLDMTRPAALADQLALRVAGAQQVSATYGTPLQVFSKAEASQLTTSLRAMPAVQKVGALRDLRAGITDPRAFSAAMGQIAPDQPVLAVAGSIMQKQAALTVPGGWFSASQEFKQGDVAQAMIEGDALLNPQSADRKEDGKTKGFPMPPDRDMRTAFAETVGDSFAGDAQGADLAYQAARAYYAGTSAKAGRIDGVFDQPTWEKAILVSTGGVVDYNGRGDVRLPWGMPEDVFVDQAEEAFQRANKAAGLPAATLDDYGLQNVGDGRYLVKAGGGYLLTRTGAPLVININNNAVPTAPVAPVQNGLQLQAAPQPETDSQAPLL